MIKIQNEAMEYAALGLALTREEERAVVLSELEESDFTEERRLLFGAIWDLFRDDAPLGSAPLRTYLEKNNLEKSLPPNVSAHMIAEKVRDSAKGIEEGGAELACKHLKKASRKRRGKEIFQEYANKSNDPKVDADQMLAEAGTKLFSLISGNDREKELPFEEDLELARQEVLSDKKQGVLTGLDLDRITNGFKRGHFVVVAGKTSHGKSALVQWFMMQFAENEGYTALASFEMGKGEIYERLFSMKSRVEHTKIAERRMDKEDQKKFNQAYEEIKNFKYGWAINPQNGSSIEQLYATARKLKLQKDLRVLIVDYIQLAHAMGETREQEVATITRELKEMARDLDITVIGLSQFNRESKDGRPQLHQLRESGAIEQDANVAILLWNPSVDGIERFADSDSEGDWAGKPTEGIVELNVAKHRGGRRGSVKIRFEPSRMQFGNLSNRKRTAMGYLSGGN